MGKFYCCLLVVLLVMAIASCTSAKECVFYPKEKRGNITHSDKRLTYPSQDCSWYITGDLYDTITISISSLNIPTDFEGKCGKYYLQIGQDPKVVYCGYDRHVYFSNSRHVVIKFVGDGRSEFELKYIMGPPYTDSCQSNEVQCSSDRKCIYKDWLCNGLRECEDSSDESNCGGTTRSKTATTETIPKSTAPCISGLSCHSIKTGWLECLKTKYICDGKVDCVDGEDETPANCRSCHHKFNEDVGYISSPMYPYDYPNNYDCQWVIHIRDTSAKIQLRFHDFNMQYEDNTDYIVIYDGSSLDSPILGNQKYYGGNRPPSIIESSSNWLMIKFHSNSFVPEKGFNMTFQRKGVCLPDQLPCGNGEIDCFEKSKKCDGIWHCKRHGGDEKGCGHCKPTHYTCGPRSSQCYQETERCNGVAHCSNKQDEFYCSPDQCGSQSGTFLCDNKHCIYETWKCDKTNDCEDNSDEINCPHSTNLIKIAAVAGSLICSLLLVVALGCTCKLYNLRMQQFHGPRYETPLSRLYAEFMRRRAPPPYHEAMLTSRPYEEARREYLEQLAGNTRPNSRQGRRSRRRPHRGRSHLQNVNENEQASTEVPANACSQETDPATTTCPSNDMQISQASGEDNSVNRTHVNIDRQSSQTALINNSDSDGVSSESDLDNGPSEGVQVEFSDEAGISAHWRRNNRLKQDSDSEQESTSQQIPPNTASGDTCSIDNTIASCDSVESPKTDTENDKNTEENINICDTNNPTSSNNRGQLIRRPSQDSLNSSGSDSPSWGDFVA